jgi:hypothetical protein
MNGNSDSTADLGMTRAYLCIAGQKYHHRDYGDTSLKPHSPSLFVSALLYVDPSNHARARRDDSSFCCLLTTLHEGVSANQQEQHCKYESCRLPRRVPPEPRGLTRKNALTGMRPPLCSRNTEWIVYFFNMPAQS